MLRKCGMFKDTTEKGALMSIVGFQHYIQERSESTTLLAPCRSCGSLLEKSVYRKWIHGFGTEYIDGRGNYMEHRPCPCCGESAPLCHLLWGSIALLLFWILGSSGLFYCASTVRAFCAAALIWVPFTIVLGYWHQRHTGRSYGPFA